MICFYCDKEVGNVYFMDVLKIVACSNCWEMFNSFHEAHQ